VGYDACKSKYIEKAQNNKLPPHPLPLSSLERGMLYEQGLPDVRQG